MKTTIVPAQITTVEDKVAGNISFTQLLLMVVPVFFGGAVFTFVPPFMEITTGKGITVMVIASLFLGLAIRIRGRLVLEWIIVRVRYNRRPRHVVFDKNDDYLRTMYVAPAAAEEKHEAPENESPAFTLREVNVSSLVHYEKLLSDPNTDIHFETTKKGGLRVYVKQID